MTTTHRSFEALTVFCGSAGGNDPRFVEVAASFGRGLAARGIRVVYGGGRVGLMGAVADAALAAGGEVIGVIPERLADLELAHHGCTRLEIVDDMHSRKARMADLGDGFVALPGGWGTMEELFEAMTWSQLGYHRKPVGVLDVLGYYAGLRGWMDDAVSREFVRPDLTSIVSFAEDADELIAAMSSARWPALEQWIKDV